MLRNGRGSCVGFGARLGATAALILGSTACGRDAKVGPTGPVASPAAVRPIGVDPPSGPMGTVFSLSIGALPKGGTVQFEITFPGQEKAYPGGPLTVGDDGTASTRYRATGTNPPGAYAVRVLGASGMLGEGSFTLTDGPAITSTILRPSTTGRIGSSTTRRSTATTKAGATTTKGTTASTAPTGSTSTMPAPAASTTTRPLVTSPRATTTTKKP